MALRRVDCPVCKRRILVTNRESATTLTCPACRRLLYVGSDGVRLHGQVDKPAETPVATPRGKSAHVDASNHPERASGSAPAVPPPISTAGMAAIPPNWLIGVATAIAGLVLFAITMILIMGSPRAARVPQESADSELDLAKWEDHSPVVLRGSREESRMQSTGGGGRENAERPRARAKSGVSSNASRHETPATASAGSDQTKRDLVRDALASVAFVECTDGNGSGFMAAPNLLVTNHHVIADARLADVRVRFPDHPSLKERVFSANLVHENPEDDLAVLEVRCAVQPLHVNPSYQHANGEKVVAIGSPGTGGGEALQNLTTDGRLGPSVRVGDGNERWALAMPINPGNSGGPVIDAVNAEVVGVVVAKFLKTEAQGLAVPHPLLVKEIQRAEASSNADRRKAESLHRQRYCLGHLIQMIALSERSFNKSCEAAVSNSEASDSDQLEAFNDFKTLATKVLSDDFTQFETVVMAEIGRLAGDPDCDPAVLAGLEKLGHTIEKQADDLRRSVRLHEVESFLREFRGSLHKAMSLARGIAKSLAMTITEEEE